MKLYYKCNLCEKIFDNEKDCLEHEKNGHIMAVKILKQESNNGVVNCEDKNGLRFPNVLYVELSDGKRGTYILTEVKNKPKEKK